MYGDDPHRFLVVHPLMLHSIILIIKHKKQTIMNTKKITILVMFFLGMLTVNAGGPSACVDWNGYVDSKNISGTGYITLEPGQEEKAAQTYQYSGPGKINQVRVYGNYPYIIGGVPLQVNIYSVDGNGRPTAILKSVNFSWSVSNNSANPALAYKDVSLGTGVYISSNFAVGVTNLSSLLDFQVRYTGNGENQGEDFASLAGTSTGNNWASAAAAFQKDGDFYLVPQMEHFNTPAFSPSASCIAPQQQVTFTNSSTLSQNRMFNKISAPGYNGSNFIYTWDFGDGTTILHSASPTHVYAAAGVYTVSLTTTLEGWNTTCTETYSIQISVGLGVAATQVTNATCFGSDNGSVVAVGSGGAGDYSYSLGGEYQSSGSFTGLEPGSYVVYVRDDLGCMSQTSFVITQPSQIVFTSTQTTTTSCGSSNGQILVSTGGGNGGPYTYTLNGGAAQSSGSFANLAAGTYSIVATAGGCSATTVVVVNNQGGPSLTLPVNKQNVSCYGTSDGAITLAATGGTGNLQYSINGGTTFQSSPSFPNLAVGTYSVFVKDAPGCLSGTVVVISEPSQLVVTANSVPVNCNGGNDGQINVTSAVGGIGALSYSVNGTAFQSGTNFPGLVAGNYTLTLQDAAGCSVSTGVTVTQPTPVSATTSVNNAGCNGATDGVVNISGTGGAGGYMYSSNGINYSKYGVFVNLGAGTYTFYVKDRNGCVYQLNATVTEPSAIVANVLTTNSTCGNSNGSLLVQTSGGSGSGYEYSLNGAAFVSNNLFNNLPAATYYVEVKDGSGCRISTSGNITDSNGPQVATNDVTSTNVSCHGGSDGSITVVNVTGGTGTLQYGLNGTAWQGSPSFFGLPAGSYTVLVRDANGCIGYQNKVITEPAAFVISTTNTDLVCNGVSAGEITISAIGGSGTLAYSVNNGASFQSSNEFSGLAAGVYTIKVRDAAGCIGSYSTTLSQPSAITILTGVLNVTCNDEGNGEITVLSSGGTGTRTYSLDGVNYQVSGSFPGLDGGPYTVYVKDGNGCVKSSTAFVVEPTPVIVSANVSDVSCAGGNNGVVNLSVSGGVSPYYYAWSDGSTTEDVFNLSAGNYSGTITDANGCTVSGSFVVNQPALPIIVNGVVTGSEGANGAVDITVTGGVDPYTYEWSNGSISQDLSALAPGTYVVEVTDSKGCATSNTFTVPSLTGIAQMAGDAKNVVVYPNPASNLATIDANGVIINKARVTNLLGQAVIEARFETSKIELNTSVLEEGVYFVTLYTNSGIVTKQLQVIR